MTVNIRGTDQPGLYCVELRTSNWDRSLTWYRDGLGLRVLVRVPDDLYALLDAGESRLALLGRKTPGPPTRRISLAFEVSDVAMVAARVAALGSQVSPLMMQEEHLREVDTTDPDGNRIRIFAWPKRH
jgi:catechol 2,3-dioxygenase-like lactoylglutathione lyase family enzyme